MIKIKKGKYFSFSTHGRKEICSGDIAFGQCSSCKTTLSPSYVKIIRDLKESNLLSKDYPLICCVCYNIKNIIGFTNCKKCGNELNIVRISIVRRRIQCFQCNKVYWVGK